MDLQLIQDLHCPYCGGGFRVARAVREEGGRLRYGLLECRCFTFPVVDGILLLSLAKGYGGAEEALQPYVPLQAAALQYLAKDDIGGLLGWIRRHMPLAAGLIEGSGDSYLTTATRLDVALEAESKGYLATQGRYEVVGVGSRLERARQRLESALTRTSRVTPEQERGRLKSYYVERFFSPRVNALALQLGSMPIQGRMLSLCCGHGVFENLLAADGRTRELVCMDGQFLNLLVVRRFAASDASFICHDVQFPLPFSNGYFSGVFSSTCLPEIPAQRSFARESIRVTADEGWTFFDSIWLTKPGARRIDRSRSHRFCQNFFARFEDYLAFFLECTPTERELGLNIPAAPAQYLADPGWTFGAGRDAALAGAGQQPFVSMLVVNKARFPGYPAPQRPWLTPQRLAVSPVFDVTHAGGALQLKRRAGFDQLHSHFVPAEIPGFPETATLDFQRCLGDPAYLLEQFCAGNLVVLPQKFSSDRAPIAEIVK